jgi:hypothetical protein
MPYDGRFAGDPFHVLSRVFGHPGFRGRQEEVVRHVAEGGSGLVLMPTGGGKSLCYQVPALCREGVGVVVSPLIALMEDQVAALRQQGVAAAALHSDLPEGEGRTVLRDLHDGTLKLLYVSPERLLLDGMLNRLDQLPIALFAVDEAHCVSQWGHHFRKEYRGLGVLSERFPRTPALALTATADRARSRTSAAARPDGGPGVPRRLRPPEHPDRGAAARDRNAPSSAAAEGTAGVPGAGIVYCGTRNKTEQTAEWLRATGMTRWPSMPGMEREAKRDAHRRFARGDAVVMCATIAFGMGIDRPDVRWVAHLDLPRRPRAGTRRSAAPDATGCRPAPCCYTAPATSRSPATGSRKAPPSLARSASSASGWKRWSRSPKPRPAAASCCCAASARIWTARAAAIATSAWRRRSCSTARWRRRRCSRPCCAPGGASASRIWWMCCAGG